LRSPFTIRPFTESFIATLLLWLPSGFGCWSRPAVAGLVRPADPARARVSVRQSEYRACAPVHPVGLGHLCCRSARVNPSTLRATVGLLYQSLCHEFTLDD
jgi:hypothetical protein